MTQMLKRLPRTAALAALVILAAISTNADKVTVDPNTLPPKPAAASTPVDARMAKKITYFSGYTRLHYVTEEIARQTGVTIRCGKDKNDWPVRDLPLAVCANDIPADKLLQAVADATHTLLTVTHVNGKSVYKVWKDAKRQRILETYAETERRYARQMDEWAWDALARLAEIPDEALGLDLSNEGNRRALEDARETGTILKHLDKNVLERARSVERVFLLPNDLPAPAREALRDSVRRHWDRSREGYRKTAEDNPSKAWYKDELADDDLDRCYVMLDKLGDDREEVDVSIAWRYSEDMSSCWGRGPGGYSFIFKDCKDPRIAPQPVRTDTLDPARFEKDIGSPKLKLLDTEADWSIKLLEQKAKPEAPRDKSRDDLTFGDALAAFAKAAGCSIVSEDFHSHRRTFEPGTIIGREATLGQILRDQRSIRWFADEESRLIVGWDKEWCKCHRDMMPESILSNIVTKLNGAGVEIDDVTPLSKFTQEQRKLWLLRNPDLEPISSTWTWGIGGGSIPWQIYDSLAPTDKALAKSEAGFPLGTLDTYVLSETFTRLNSRAGSPPSFFTKSGRSERKGYGLPEDPDEIAQATLRVVRYVPDTIRVPEPGKSYRNRIVETPADFDKHQYTLEIAREGSKAVFAGPLDLYCPVYSAKREAESERAKKDSDAKVAPNSASP